jgi:hypothetical protein
MIGKKLLIIWIWRLPGRIPGAVDGDSVEGVDYQIIEGTKGTGLL